MSHTLAEQALARVFDYLVAMGVTPSRDVTLDAMRLVQEGLEANADDVLAWVMERVPQRFSLQEVQMPNTFPPILRGSIGYGDSK